jgi:hypothetical protein
MKTALRGFVSAIFLGAYRFWDRNNFCQRCACKQGDTASKGVMEETSFHWLLDGWNFVIGCLLMIHITCSFMGK